MKKLTWFSGVFGSLPQIWCINFLKNFWWGICISLIWARQSCNFALISQKTSQTWQIVASSGRNQVDERSSFNFCIFANSNTSRSGEGKCATLRRSFWGDMYVQSGLLHQQQQWKIWRKLPCCCCCCATLNDAEFLSQFSTASLNSARGWIVLFLRNIHRVKDCKDYKIIVGSETDQILELMLSRVGFNFATCIVILKYDLFCILIPGCFVKLDYFANSSVIEQSLPDNIY